MSSRALQYGLLAAAISSLLVRPTAGAEPPTRRFLRTHCVRCHGPETQEADVRLDDVARLDDEPQFQSWHRIWSKVNAGQMPPEDEPQPSDGARREFLEWVRATYGVADVISAEAHWAFKQPVDVAIPMVAGASNPIDGFVSARLAAAGLSPSPEADQRALLRRVTFDLTGLPPTLDEFKAFERDAADATVDSAAAYIRLVDRLLASPRYGERWAQHWLDVIRWAETVGFETNAERTNAWHYRDWVIRAWNDDLPYDHFVEAQLVGDAVGTDAALGFLVAGPANLPGQIGRDEEAMRHARQDELDEVVRTVSQAFFGLTIGCARCHDHKFDPILQRDYYSLQAVFAGLSYGHRRLRGEQNDRWMARVPAARVKLAELTQQLEQFRRRHNLRPPVEAMTTESFDAVVCDAVRMDIQATDGGAASLYEMEVIATGRSVDSARNGDGNIGSNGDRDVGPHADTNVALASAGGKPSASSFALANQTRHFDNLVDGSIDQRQAFPWDAAQGGPAWVQVELALPARVHKVIWHAGSSTPVSYELSVRDRSTQQWRTVAHTRDRLPCVSDARHAADVELAGVDDAGVRELAKLLADIRSQQSLVARLSAGPQTYAASFSPQPEMSWLLNRGDPMQRTVEVAPDVPEFLRAIVASSQIRTDVADGVLSEQQRRRNLARHLTNASHPLTARVIVNRVWQHHFGTGLVQTPSDFGRMGAAASHPELLDWLAIEFVRHDWSLKWLHRVIVTSATYRQASHLREQPRRADAESRLLWRFPPRRLEAEAIRDAVLAVSGTLYAKMYGRGFDLFDLRGGLSDYHAIEEFHVDGWRRMIYAHKVRMQAVDVFGAFDCPDAGQMTPKRNQSTTPIQSLGLFNSPFINRQSKFCADRVRDASPNDTARAVELVFQLALTRLPTDAERDRMTKLAETHGLAQVCRVIFNTTEFVFLR